MLQLLIHYSFPKTMQRNRLWRSSSFPAIAVDIQALPILSKKCMLHHCMFRSLLSRRKKTFTALINFSQNTQKPLSTESAIYIAVCLFVCLYIIFHRHHPDRARRHVVRDINNIKKPLTVHFSQLNRTGWHISVYKFIKIKLLFITLLPRAVPANQFLVMFSALTFMSIPINPLPPMLSMNNINNGTLWHMGSTFSPEMKMWLVLGKANALLLHTRVAFVHRAVSKTAAPSVKGNPFLELCSEIELFPLSEVHMSQGLTLMDLFRRLLGFPYSLSASRRTAIVHF